MTGFLVFLVCFVGYCATGTALAVVTFGFGERHNRWHKSRCCTQSRYDNPHSRMDVPFVATLVGMLWPLMGWVLLTLVLVHRAQTRAVAEEDASAERAKILAAAMKELGDV